MSCLRESIRHTGGDLAELLVAVENAPTLAAMMLAAWQLARAIAVAVVEDVLAERARHPTEWPMCKKCSKRLESKGFIERTLRGLNWVTGRRAPYDYHVYLQLCFAEAAIDRAAVMCLIPQGFAGERRITTRAADPATPRA